MKKIDELHGSIWNEIHITNGDKVHEVEYEDYDYLCFEGNKNIVSIPEPPQLNHVLLWLSLKDRNKYNHFEASKGVGDFVIYDSEEGFCLTWDLTKNYLDEQSNELIDWLHSLI